MPGKDGSLKTVYKTPKDDVVVGKNACIRRLIEKGALNRENVRSCILLEPEMFHELELHSKTMKV